MKNNNSSKKKLLSNNNLKLIPKNKNKKKILFFNFLNGKYYLPPFRFIILSFILFLISVVIGFFLIPEDSTGFLGTVYVSLNNFFFFFQKIESFFFFVFFFFDLILGINKTNMFLDWSFIKIHCFNDW